ncbi:PREDICTED: uncharacterized protein LOC109591491, partial [Amphimedon queenslandica]|uniref:Protein kinase domain-containing protein n=2 Tax=Amphimedon queenslandica TaxID=400682 RepID=A0AAN0K085_AMPQE
MNEMMAALMRALKPAKAVPSPPVKNYEPAKRLNHSTVLVGDCLYMWGGERDDRLKEHNIEIERRDSSFVEVLHLPTGRWEQKPTTGDPPLGIMKYAAVAIGNEIFYYGGRCSHFHYDVNVLYSLNVDTLKWRKVVPTNPEDGPKRKDSCGMIAVKIEGEDYLVIIEPGSIHYFRIATGQWISPKVTGDDISRIYDFNLMSVDDTSAILLEDHHDNISDNYVHRLTFTKGSVVFECIFYGRMVLDAPWFVHPNRSVLLTSPSGLKLLAIGDSQCETFDINKTNWKKVDVPESVKNRNVHSLSVWNEDTTNTWIIEFGEHWGGASLSDTAFLNIRYTAGGDISVRTYSLREYQEEMGKRRRSVEQEVSQKRERIMEERHQQEIQQLHLQMEERDQQAREREREMEKQLQERERESQEIERQLRGELQQFEQRERQLQEEVQELRTQNDEREKQFQEREQELQQQLEQSAQQLEEKDRQLEEQESAWVVNGDEIRMTETVLGNGGYGEVRVATFRGLRVAAKSLHRVILSPY